MQLSVNLSELFLTYLYTLLTTNSATNKSKKLLLLLYVVNWCAVMSLQSCSYRRRQRARQKVVPFVDTLLSYLLFSIWICICLMFYVYYLHKNVTTGVYLRTMTSSLNFVTYPYPHLYFITARWGIFQSFCSYI